MAQVVLSEVMYDPIGNENYDEFIELYNISETDSVGLSGWQISDGAGADESIDAGEGTVLLPGQFGIILDPDYFGNSTSYDALTSPEAPLLVIDNSTFGSRGLSNSTPVTVYLYET